MDYYDDDFSNINLNPRELYQEGLKCYRAKDYKTAISYFNQALDINPQYESALNAKGVAFFSLGEYSNSIICFDQVISINPLNNKAIRNRERAQEKFISKGSNSVNQPTSKGKSQSKNDEDLYSSPYYKKNYFLFLWLFCMIPFAFGGIAGIIIYVALSSIFVYIDATRIGAGTKKNSKGGFDYWKPSKYAVFTFLLWIITYPVYLYSRHMIFDKNHYNIDEGYKPPQRGINLVAGPILFLILIIITSSIMMGTNRSNQSLSSSESSRSSMSMNSPLTDTPTSPTLLPRNPIIGVWRYSDPYGYDNRYRFNDDGTAEKSIYNPNNGETKRTSGTWNSNGNIIITVLLGGISGDVIYHPTENSIDEGEQRYFSYQGDLMPASAAIKTIIPPTLTRKIVTSVKWTLDDSEYDSNAKNRMVCKQSCDRINSNCYSRCRGLLSIMSDAYNQCTTYCWEETSSCEHDCDKIGMKVIYL